MNTKRWQTVKEILNEALDLSADEIGPFLEESCDGDAELRREVDSLLEGREEAAEFIEKPVVRLSYPEPPAEPAGTRFGAYEVREVLARGGMGTVYLAARADGAYEAQAALKILHRGMDTDEIVRRFEAERQILASLKHPFIAELLDGGSTPDGRPFLVMEYIEGTPIDEFCDDQRWTVRQRLRLFQRVCRAVEHAHRAMVVHRDLKPANILVLDNGTPKLLDFGIAKLLAPETSVTALTQGMGPRIFTPGYASPEQLRGEPVGAATDTYSLGVLLYQLLTGRRPYPIPDTVPETAGQTLMNLSIARPSTIVRRPYRVTTGAVQPGEEVVTFTAEELSRRRSEEPRSLQRLLAGDLDSILLKALRPEPGERYASVADLARDIEAYLEDRPVQARRGTVRYRASKFLQRRRVPLVVAAGLISLLGYGAWQRLTAQQERQRTEQQRVQAASESRKAKTLEDFLIDFLAGSDPDDEAWRNATLLDVLAYGAEILPQRLQEEPLIRASLMTTVGRVYQKHSELEKARPLLEASLEIRREEYGELHEQVAFSQVHLGKLMADLRRFEEAEALTRRGVETLRQLVGGSEPAWVAMAENNLAYILQEQKSFAEAETLFRKVLESKRETSGPASDDLAIGIHNLAAVLQLTGQDEEAIRLYRETIRMRRDIDLVEKASMTRSLGNLAILLEAHGELEEAEKHLREAVRIRRILFGDDHVNVGISLNNLALVQLAQGRYEDAEASFREEERIFREAGREDTSLFGVLLCNQARLDLALGRFGQAEERSRQALELYTKHEADAWRRADASSLLGASLAYGGRPEEGGELLRNAYDELKSQLPSRRRQFEEARGRLARFYESRGESREAEALLVAAPGSEVGKSTPAKAPARNLESSG